jgi:hypothetical protein
MRATVMSNKGRKVSLKLLGQNQYVKSRMILRNVAAQNEPAAL